MARKNSPAKKTGASICQVTVSKPTITPSFMPFPCSLCSLCRTYQREHTLATPYVAGTPNGGNQAAKASPPRSHSPMYLKGESPIYVVLFLFHTIHGATTVSAEEEILEGEEVVISSLSFVNARTPEVLLKVLLDNRCFKFLLLSPWTNLNDAPRDLWWFFLHNGRRRRRRRRGGENSASRRGGGRQRRYPFSWKTWPMSLLLLSCPCVSARANNLRFLNLLFWISGLINPLLSEGSLFFSLVFFEGGGRLWF